MLKIIKSSICILISLKQSYSVLSVFTFVSNYSVLSLLQNVLQTYNCLNANPKQPGGRDGTWDLGGGGGGGGGGGR
jgi:uncharacterized membrane protein